jgi:hypothetical protein
MRTPYAIAALAIFAIEVLIALFVRDAFVRPYLGDVLAVALVYCGLRAGLPLGVRGAILIALEIAVVVELMQLIGLLRLLGLEDNRIARILLGGSFDPLDLLAYGAGAAAIALIEWRRGRR